MLTDVAENAKAAEAAMRAYDDSINRPADRKLFDGIKAAREKFPSHVTRAHALVTWRDRSSSRDPTRATLSA